MVQVTDQATVGVTQHTIETHLTNSGNRKAFGTNPAAEVVDSDLGTIRSWAYGPDGAALDTSAQAIVTSDGVDAVDMKTEGQTTVMIVVLVNQLVAAAAERWRSGDCVDVKVLEGNGGEVEPGDVVHVVAQPRHKIDQADLAKPVVATFSGKASAERLGVAVPAPAGFDVTAGEEDGDTGTLTLTSTSNRGIGTTSVLFKVAKKQTPTPPPPTPPPTPRPGEWSGTVVIEYTRASSDSESTDYGSGSYISNSSDESVTITTTYELNSVDPSIAPGEMPLPAGCEYGPQPGDVTCTDVALVALTGVGTLVGEISNTHTVLTVSRGANEDPGHPDRMIGCDYDKSSIRTQDGSWAFEGDASGMLSVMADGRYQITLQGGGSGQASVPGTTGGYVRAAPRHRLCSRIFLKHDIRHRPVIVGDAVPIARRYPRTDRPCTSRQHHRRLHGPDGGGRFDPHR